jgi:nitrous oxidase accessory protein
VVVDKAITLRGLDTGAGKPVIDAGGVGSGITISADGATIEGFEVRNSGELPGDAGIRATSMNNTIRNNEIRSNGGCGVRLERSGGNSISKNVIYQNRKHGISLDEANLNEIEENEVKENGSSLFSVGNE